MKSSEIRSSFLEFFESRGHTVVPSSSLLPSDPSVLFTSAGMQQFKPYYTGELNAQKDFDSLNTTSIQKSIRTSDIDEVGDESHLTFFEMLGNFSFGGYFKKEAIEWGYEFITNVMGLTIDFVSVFGGEDGIEADEESEKIWKKLDKDITVRRFGREDNFWGPTGSEGPCGPTTEIYVDGIEIWNIVFNQYFCSKDGSLKPLETSGIDTGMGLERLALVSQFPLRQAQGKLGRKPTIFDTDLFTVVMRLVPEVLDVRIRRIIADHTRAVAFMLGDGVRPSNKDQGYVLRRLMRRVIVHEHLSDGAFDVVDVLRGTIREYKEWYPDLDEDVIIEAFETEHEKFGKTVTRGLREMDRLDVLDAEASFRLYESFGLPYEIIKELGGPKAATLSREEFDAKFKEHQERSRAGQEKKFGGHGLLLDTGELKAANEEELQKVTRLHTATHLLHAALRKVLGDEVQQAGSDITVERTRFDFTFPRKLTADEKNQVEHMVNKVVDLDLPVHMKTLPIGEAKQTGALFFFKEKYPDEVNVYFVGKDMDSAFSKEFCGGPHVTHTGAIGTVRIIKEEATSAGVRRIRATVE